ncbi:MAG: hypothetical protein WA324_00415 [Bryobacteraceae bacterium]
MSYEPELHLRTQADIDQFENYVRLSFSRHRLPVERYSQTLFSQLPHMPGYGCVNRPFQFVEYEIRCLEGLGDSSTKPAQSFSEKGQLHGFMHKHFFVPGYKHLGVNAELAWKLDKPNSGKLPQMIQQVAKRHNNNRTEADTQQFSAELAKKFVYGPDGLLYRLSGKATGDWIIFLPHESKNYYLCIAKHDEDDFILEAIQQCAAESPFITDVLARPTQR